MKRFNLIVITILITLFWASAQSNEILLKPNWKVGDIMHYQKNVKTLNVNQKNDTTIKKQGQYDFYLKVIDKNESGYTLSLDYPSSMYTQLIPNLQSLKSKEYLSVHFTTDLMGSFIELKNTDSLQDFMREIMNNLYDVLPSSEMSKDEFLTYMKKVYSPEMQIASLKKDIDLILWQNGLEAEIGYLYESQASINMFNTEIPTKTILSLDVDIYNGAPIAYIVETETEYDKDSLKPFIYSFLHETADSFKGNSKFDENEMKEFFSKAEIGIVDYNYTILLVETGCVYNTQSVRETEISSPEGNMREIRISEIQQID